MLSLNLIEPPFTIIYIVHIYLDVLLEFRGVTFLYIPDITEFSWFWLWRYVVVVEWGYHLSGFLFLIDHFGASPFIVIILILHK